MRSFLLAVDYRSLNMTEAAVAEESFDFHFGESQPEIGVHFAGFFEMVLHQVEHGDPSARLEDAMCLVDGTLGMRRVMQRLAEEGEIDRGVVDRHRFEVALAVLQIPDAMLAREAGAE